ncbi:MAG TPA: 50S ribosomal protein L9 [Hyphomicrobiales bacterium]|nr:50S ribosomal protein L9 [Hyphomicrobiales bacterium]
MEVILLQRLAKVGQMGDVVRVRDGYARNFLLPSGKALRATEANRARFERERTQLEARNLEQKNEASRVSETLEGKSFMMIRPAGETGQLYGSVSTRDIAAAITEGGITVARQQVVLNTPIKSIGLYTVPVALHPEVEVMVTVNVARSAEEGERQARGEDLTRREEGPAFETYNPEAEEQETPTPIAAPAAEGEEG